jgi:hypothetical protein
MRNGRATSSRSLERFAHALQIDVPPAVAEAVAKQNPWHGVSGVNSPTRAEYQAFKDMHRRVSNPNHPDYPRYGGAGITIHETWSNTPEGFRKFFEDLGPRPSPDHSLHRSPPNANYGPSTTSWVDKQRQSLERRGRRYFEVNGQIMGRDQFLKVGEEEGFFQVVHRRKDGSLKTPRKRKKEETAA